jgi:hypothetical protein
VIVAVCAFRGLKRELILPVLRGRRFALGFFARLFGDLQIFQKPVGTLKARRPNPYQRPSWTRQKSIEGAGFRSRARPLPKTARFMRHRFLGPLLVPRHVPRRVERVSSLNLRWSEALPYKDGRPI